MRRYLAIFFLCIFGCELVVDIDVPFEGGKLTLNSFFSPDSLWKAQLNLNRHVLDETPFQAVDNGSIVIYEGTNPIDTLISEGNGLYRSDSARPQAGKQYEVKAEAGNFQAVQAISSAPVPVELLDVETSEEITEEQVSTKFKILFSDDGARSDYYRIILEMAQEQYDVNTKSVIQYWQRIPLSPEDPEYENEDFNYQETIMVSDALFNGKEAELSFSTPIYGVLGYPIVVLSLQTLSEDCYRYLITSELQRNTSGDPFAQPVNVHNNITNGFGIFAGYSSSRRLWEGPKPVITDISPMHGKPGDRIIITGENFNTSPYGSIVRFDGDPYPWIASTLVVSETQMEAIVPDQAITGKIIIQTQGRVILSDGPFTIDN